MLKVLKEIYEVAKALQVRLMLFINKFHYPSVKEQIIQTAPNAAEGSLRPLGGVRCGEPVFECLTTRQTISYYLLLTPENLLLFLAGVFRAAYLTYR